MGWIDAAPRVHRPAAARRGQHPGGGMHTMTQFGASSLTGEQIVFDQHLDRLAEQAVDAPVLAPSPASSLGVFASRLYWSGNQAPVAPVADDPVLRSLLERQRERSPQAATPRLTMVPIGQHEPVAIRAEPFG